MISTQARAGTTANPSIPSRQMDPFPDNFGPIFFQNQFRTTIELPTREKYPNATGKCAIITGSNSGLGFEAARQLLSLGLSHLVMGVRSLQKGKAAAAKLQLANPSASIDVWSLDMESYESIQAFSRKCEKDLSRIDMVILNAGRGPMTFTTIPSTGHEKTVQVNHFGTALLAVLMLPIMKSKSNGRDTPHLTTVSSVTTHRIKFPNRDERPLLASFDNTSITTWDPRESYGASKLLSQLFFVKLSEIVKPDDVIINMVDPGLVKGTGLARDATGLSFLAVKLFFTIAGRHVSSGAATYVDAVLGHGKESHGCFLMNCQIAPLAGWYYTHGKELLDVVWIETLKDLSFAGVEQILASFSS
ncbi:hypothetical protein BX600DRAFT_387849 [Xylariales sp. PMI_506]|nr:hypothetical protein BX600DRAFT_387849 [Xylariales sp. PMI_506]